MMNFLGSIGSMMRGSELEEALEQVYGANAVTHMMQFLGSVSIHWTVLLD